MSKIFQSFCVFIALSGSILVNSFFESKSDTPLIQAVKDGNRKVVKKLLSSGVDVNELGQDYKTALDAAVEYGYAKIALCLIKYKAKVTCDDNQSYIKVLCKAESKRLLILFPILLITCAVIGAVTAYPVMLIATSCSFASPVANIFCLLSASVGIIAGYGLFGYALTLPIRSVYLSNKASKNWMLPVSKVV